MNKDMLTHLWMPVTARHTSTSANTKTTTCTKIRGMEKKWNMITGRSRGKYRLIPSSTTAHTRKVMA